MKTKLVIIAAFVLAAVAIVLFSLKNHGEDGAKGRASLDAAAPSPTDAGAPVEITMLYGTEKKDWIEDVAASFAKAHPEISVKLVGKGSFEAEQAILDEREKPTLFSPADSLILNLLDADWNTKNRTKLFSEGEDAPQTLVITPLVFVAWEDRASVLSKGTGGTITWKTIRKAVASPQGWAGVGGKPEWGFVKLGHTDPTRSNSGLQSLVLMSLDYYGKTTLDIGDVLKPDYQAFVKDVEKGVTKFEASTGTFMTDMVRFGPSKYDVSLVYENLAVSQLENAQGRWGNLKVYYPQTTLWSDHPIAVLNADWVSPAQRAAARTWIAWLKSRPNQERALAYGFRPGDPAVPVKTADPQNPFTRLAQYGVRVDIGTVAPPPAGPVVRNLVTMWSRVVAPSR